LGFPLGIAFLFFLNNEEISKIAREQSVPRLPLLCKINHLYQHLIHTDANIHSKDVVKVFDAFLRNPGCGEVYNLGGGRKNSVSIIEAIQKVEEISGVKLHWEYSETPRVGDHICYISNLSKLKSHFPEWDVSIGMDEMLVEMIEFAQKG